MCPVEGMVCSMGVDGTGYRAYKTGPGLLMLFTRVDNMLLWVTSDQGQLESTCSWTPMPQNMQASFYRWPVLC